MRSTLRPATPTAPNAANATSERLKGSTGPSCGHPPLSALTGPLSLPLLPLIPLFPKVDTEGQTAIPAACFRAIDRVQGITRHPALTLCQIYLLSVG